MEEQSNSVQSRESMEEEIPKDFINRKISQLSDLQLRYTYSNASRTSQFSMEESSTCDQFESKYVRDEELYSQLLEKVAQVRAIVNLEPQDICLYILQYYQWNLQKLGNLYFTDNWQNIKNNQIKYSESSGVNSKNGQCQVCLMQVQLYSTCFCPHFYCRPCWTYYLKQELMNGRIFSKCMNSPPCQNAPILKTFLDTIAPKLSELNRKKICINYAIQNKDICYCPNQKCPYFCIKPNMMELNTVTCPCGQLYCFKCQKEPHYPISCDKVNEWYKLINSQTANSQWIKNNTRQCPKCKQPIEKKVGCCHMKCLCQCQFCYQCNKIWDEQHALTKTECPNRKNLKKVEKNEDKITNLDKYLIEVMKQSDRNKKLLMQCQQQIQDQTLLGRVVQLKTDVVSAWMTFKWTKIHLCLNDRHQIDSELEKEFIESIRSVMVPIQIIIKNAKNLASKELHYYGEQVLQRKEVLKKNIRTWLDAWEYVSS